MIAGFTNEQIVAAVLFLIGGNEGIRAIRTAIINWWKKRSKKSTEKEELIQEITKAIKENIPACEVLHSGIYTRIQETETKLAGLIKERTESDGIKNKYNETLANTLPCFTIESIRNFASYKADAFFTYIKDHMDTIYSSENEYKNSVDMLKSLYLTVKCEGCNLAGEEYTNMFYEDYHKKSTQDYLDALESLKQDRANNKRTRFVNISLNYLQQFLSEMIRAHDVLKARMEWLRQSSLELSDRK